MDLCFDLSKIMVLSGYVVYTRTVYNKLVDVSMCEEVEMLFKPFSFYSDILSKLIFN